MRIPLLAGPALAVVLSLPTATTAAVAAARPAPSGPGAVVFDTFDPNGGDATTIAVAPPDGGRRRTLVRYGSDPRWSPDHTRIAVSGCTPAVTPPCATTLLRGDGSLLRRLPMPHRFGTDTSFGPTVWTPDGARLAGGADSDDTSLNGIWTVRASDGRGLRRVTHNPHGIDIPGSWSPDGRWLSFVRDRVDADDVATAVGVFLVHADGTGLHRLTPRSLPANPEHGGRWSPDGRSILFDARPDDDSRFTLWTIHPDGRHLRRLATALPCGGSLDDPASFGCFAPAWSPSGRALVFGTLDAATGRRELYTMRPDGSRLTRITSGKAATDVPDWG